MMKHYTSYLYEEKKSSKKGRKKKKRPKVNLILSLIFDIGPSNWNPSLIKHTHCTLRNNNNNNVEKGPIHGSICFKLILGLLVFGLLSKVTLRRTIKMQDGIVAKK